MTVRAILTQADEVSLNILRERCLLVEDFGDGLWRLVDDMWDSMYAARGVGLAATQIGSHLRVAVIDTIQGPNSHRRLVLVNPRITASRGEQVGDEGCLSMPGTQWPISRAAVVTVSFQGLNGKQRTLTARDFFARAIQHECDHLDGILCNSKAEIPR
jgi:peptide deformylase